MGIGICRFTRACKRVHAHAPPSYTCPHTCLYTCPDAHVWTQVWTYMYTHAHARIYAHFYAYFGTHVDTHIYSYRYLSIRTAARPVAWCLARRCLAHAARSRAPHRPGERSCIGCPFLRVAGPDETGSASPMSYRGGNDLGNDLALHAYARLCAEPVASSSKTGPDGLAPIFRGFPPTIGLAQ